MKTNSTCLYGQRCPFRGLCAASTVLSRYIFKSYMSKSEKIKYGA